MKIKSFVFLLLFVQSAFPQDIFQLVKNSDLDAVRNYEGPVNLRDTNQATPLMWAVYVSDLKMVKHLVKKGADVTLKGWIFFTDSISHFEFIYGSCLVIAAGEGKKDVLKYLLNRQNISVEDKEINLYENVENGWNALQWASVRAKNHIVKYLVKKGADINAPAQADLNQTPLILAINFNRDETALLLTKLGADVNQCDDYGVSPLTYALELQAVDLIELMIKKGAITSDIDYEIIDDQLK